VSLQTSEQLSGVPRHEVLRASPPMFESRWLDMLTRIHPAVPPLIFLPAITILFVLAFGRLAVWATLLLAFGGYGFWTFCEYWVHRGVFHLEPENAIGQRLHWIIHGVHHDHPNDPLRLVLPPAVSIPLAAGFLGLFVAVLGTPVAWAVCAGFYAGYLFYDMLHYTLHHTRPKSRLGKRFRELHMRHHFEDDDTGYGVSAPWWDWVFRTSPRRAGTARHA
jgi:dihydroceramide fatty acyl 2-hydroxylase